MEQSIAEGVEIDPIHGHQRFNNLRLCLAAFLAEVGDEYLGELGQGSYYGLEFVLAFYCLLEPRQVGRFRLEDLAREMPANLP